MQLTYSYDKLGRLKVLTDAQGGRTSYVYDRDGREKRRELPNGMVVSNTYDPVGNLLCREDLDSAEAVTQRLEYGYNRTDRRTSLATLDGRLVGWSYDDDYQLNGEQQTGSTSGWATLTEDQWSEVTVNGWSNLRASPSPSYSISTTYDEAGNPIVEVEDGTVTTNTYDGSDRLTLREFFDGVSTTTTTFTYDGAGNRTSKVEQPAGTTTYTWDADNRLRGVELPTGGRYTFSYNADGLRTSRRAPAGGTVKYVWNGQVLMATTDRGPLQPTGCHELPTFCHQ